MAEYQLSCFGESGNSYKAALYLELVGADWEPAFVDFFNGAARTPEFREQNVMGEAPILVHGEVTLTQSGVILDYLVEQFGEFGPHTPEERREIWRWILFDNHKFTSYLATRRFQLAMAKTGETPVTEFFAGRMKAAFATLEAHLGTRDFVVGERPTIADLSLSGYLHYGDELHWDLDAYPRISGWLERIRALPGWRHPYDLMPRGRPAGA